MRNNIFKIMVATVSIATLSGCASGPDSTYSKMGDAMKDIAVAVLSPASQNTTNTQSQATEIGRYIKPMLDGCDFVELDKLVQEQPGAIADHQKISKPQGDDPNETTTVILKDAVAFGYPLQKIETYRGYNQFHSKLFFKNDNFVNLRSAFKVPQDSESDLTRNDINGYQVGGYEFVALKFDRQNRTVRCDRGI
ncbi:hypothetical protein [Psychrobacter sp. FDAARGOS_221]|uniref:hypothetical protein n=1 Tax=Psychrobacter sp. FDAARGOS_221 TaxID=1975705 RepID=UPI000BB53C25|nr:hypothetical protein [Psychrobacter sp. FDAARGOS_221]PNK59667.1 hypothetical protein A6J60_001395 [Psychrobacter sp. FDAARGOS_221]